MGRPKGSKNKAKGCADRNSTKHKTGDVVCNLPKPVKKIVERGLKQASEGKLEDLAPVLEETDEEEPTLEDALKDLGSETEKKPFRGIKQKKMAEQIEWIFEELKNLRNYIQRIDEARLNLPKNESTVPDTDVVKRKRRIKPSTNEENKEV